MVSKQEENAMKENGHVVMDALRNINTAPTLVNLTKYISTTHKTSPEKVKEPLKKVLESGMAIGILTRQKGKYYLYGEEEDEEDEEEEPTKTGEVMDATHRRRRSHGSTSRKSGMSRSRKRRSTSKKMGSTSRSRTRGSRRRRSMSPDE